MHFYLTPPTGKTLPLKVIYPVMERFSLGGIFNSNDTKNITIKLKAFKDNSVGEASLSLPKGWNATPSKIAFDF